MENLYCMEIATILAKGVEVQLNSQDATFNRDEFIYRDKRDVSRLICWGSNRCT